MLEIAIPKDIREYKPKLVGPFTTRQVICGVIAVASAYFAYFAQKIIGLEPRGFLCFIFATPGFLFGWIRPYGMNMEKFLKTAFFYNYLAPKTRPFKTKDICGLSKKKKNTSTKSEIKTKKQKSKKVKNEGYR